MPARSRAEAPQIAEDRSFQERFWAVERVAWIGFVLLIVVAVSGLLGSGGPLSRGEAASGDSRIDYPAQARWEAGEELNIRLGGEPGERTLALSETFADAFEIEDIQPPPTRVESGANGQSLIFLATGPEPIEVRVAMTPRNPGLARYTITPAGQAALTVATFVWP
jgi:hypothetical protein